LRHASLAADRAELADRVEGPDFVVGVDDRDDSGVFADPPDKVPGIHPPELVHREEIQRETKARGQVFRGAEYSRVFHRGREDACGPAGFPLGERRSPEGKIVALGTARGEDDFAGITSEALGDRPAGAFHRGLRRLPPPMDR
jgi:hypothetical protein